MANVFEIDDPMYESFGISLVWYIMSMTSGWVLRLLHAETAYTYIKSYLRFYLLIILRCRVRYHASEQRISFHQFRPLEAVRFTNFETRTKFVDIPLISFPSWNFCETNVHRSCLLSKCSYKLDSTNVLHWLKAKTRHNHATILQDFSTLSSLLPSIYFVKTSG